MSTDTLEELRVSITKKHATAIAIKERVALLKDEKLKEVQGQEREVQRSFSDLKTQCDEMVSGRCFVEELPEGAKEYWACGTKKGPTGKYILFWFTDNGLNPTGSLRELFDGEAWDVLCGTHPLSELSFDELKTRYKETMDAFITNTLMCVDQELLA